MQTTSRTAAAATEPPPTDQADGGTDRRRRWPAVVAVAALAVGAGGAALAMASDADTPASTDATTPVTTATVQTRDLVSTTTLEGTLTYTDSRTVAVDVAGTVTALPEIGTTVAPGEALLEIDGVPVPLLPGDLPLWRALSVDSEDGKDVTVLEQALIDLGYATEDELTIDEEFTSVTGDAVAAFREAAGLEEDESLAPGEVVVLPGAVRIAGHGLELGDRVQSGTTALTVTGTQRIVTVDLAAGEQDVLTEGDVVEVELPDDSVATGTVTHVSPVAEARTGTGANAETTYVVPAEITLDEGGETFDEAPVTISVTDEVATGILAVPVEAVLALAEGGYALEVVGPDGGTTLVAVTLGDFSDGWVEVTGEGIADGTEVVSA